MSTQKGQEATLPLRSPGAAPEADTPTSTLHDSPAPRPRALAPASAGRYEIREEIGHGGMGLVYRAWDSQLQRDVALKTLRGGEDADPQDRLRLLREAQTASQLHHPNIVQLYDCFEDQGQVYLTMRLVAGRSLSQRLREDGPLPPADAARIALQLARALAHAHAQGIIHRDIKPSNVLIEADRPVLTDFGLARALDAQDHELTRDSQLLGTPAYMAPEIIRAGASAAGPLSDQFALGVVLYEMLTGRPHGEGSNPHEYFAATLSGRQPVLPRSVPAALRWICDRARAPEPEDRFATLGAMVEALEEQLRGVPVHLRAEALEARARRLLRSQRSRALSGFGLLAAMGLALVVQPARRALDESAREDRAEQRRLAMEARVDSLLLEGKEDEAMRMFRVFVDLPENQETMALARAWLSEAQRLSGTAEDARRQNALSTAYTMASSPELQEEALLGLAEDFHARGQWDGLRSVLATLGQERSARAPALRGLARDLAVTEGDLGRATLLNDDPELQPLLDALQQVGRTGLQARLGLRWDADGDGSDELGLFEHDHETLTLLPGPDGPLAPRPPLRLPQEWRGLWAPVARELPRDQPPPLLAQVADECFATVPAAGKLEILGRWPCQLGRAAALGDFDGDGASELVASDNRRLLRVPMGPGEATVLDTSLKAANSEIRALLPWDLDEDGREELLVATSMWGAYDVRVLRAEGGAMPMSTRLQLGDLLDLHPVRVAGQTLFGTTQNHEPSTLLSPEIFGQDLPHGAAHGLHLLAWTGERLRPEALFPWPDPPVRRAPDSLVTDGDDDDGFFAGDLDGDGTDELALLVRATWTWLCRRGADGRWRGIALDGYRPLAFVDLDRDGDDELALSEVATREVYIVGLGSDGLPLRRRDAARPEPAPEGLDPDLRPAWERAEDLVSMGLTEAAVTRLQAIAELSGDSLGHAQALRRAASLLESTSPSEAVKLYLEAASEPEIAAEALERAFWLQVEDRRHASALETGARRATLPAPPAELLEKLEELRARREPEPLSLLPIGSDTPPWRFLLPFGLRLGPRGLDLRSASEHLLARIPLEWERGPITLEVVADLLFQDWSGEVFIGLGDEREWRTHGVQIATFGGASRYHHVAQCTDVPGYEGRWPEQGSEVRVAWTFDPKDRTQTCTIFDAKGSELFHRVYNPTRQRVGDTRFLGIWSGGLSAVSEIGLRSLTVSGLQPRAEEDDPETRVAGLLVAGRAEEVLELKPPASALARVVALGELGETGRLTREIRQAEELWPSGALLDLLLLWPERYSEATRAALGDRWIERFLAAYSTVAHCRAKEQPTLEALTRWTTGTERARPNATVLELLVLRARALHYLGRRDEALQIADVAKAGLGALSGDDLDLIAPNLFMARALIFLGRGDDASAMASLKEALGSSPAPEVLADKMAALPELRPLHDDPGWRVIEAARGGASAGQGGPGP